MKRELLSRALGDIDERYLEEAYRAVPGAAAPPERTVQMNRKRVLAFALAAALVLSLGAAAYAAHVRRVQELVMKDDAPEYTENSGSQNYDPLPENTDMISLQGYAESPEYLAAYAWAEFQHVYDRDGEILAGVGNGPTPWSEKYGHNGYSVYSQEMADRLEEIAAEYGLSLHSGGLQTADSMAAMYERFGHFCNAEEYGGYYYEDGTFQCDGTYDGLDFQIRRCMKGTLDTVGLNIADAASYEQWAYQTACGETVLLALGPHKALIIADLAQSFVVVNVLAGTDTWSGEAAFGAKALETFADSINFGIL